MEVVFEFDRKLNLFCEVRWGPNSFKHLLACQNGVWPSMNHWYRMLFNQTSTLIPNVRQKLTKHVQNNQLPTKSHVKSDRITLLFVRIEKLGAQDDL